MALTKHQKLAKGIKSLLDSLEIHFQKTAKSINCLQLAFYETYLMIGRPLMNKHTLNAMMHTHLFSLKFFSINENIRKIAKNSPLINMIITPIYPLSRVRVDTPGQAETTKRIIPWGVKMTLPNESLEKLKETQTAAILYCASETEMSKWIQWFEQEDKAKTFTNTLLAIGDSFQQKALLDKNLLKLARPLYKRAILEYYRPEREPKEFKTLVKIEFAPQEKTTLFEAYQTIITCIKKRRKKHFEVFQRFWKDKLERLIFEGLDWPIERRYHFLDTYFSSKTHKPNKHPGVRWETSKGVDRQSYGSFIYYFANLFLENPLKNKVQGEITLILWTMLYISRTNSSISITQLLEVTTKDISEQFLCIEDQKTELSLGWAYLIQEYMGKLPLQRQQKLFPNLTIDKLEDHFRKASAQIFPSESTNALPEAFLSFPHPEKGQRIPIQERRSQQQNPPKVFHDPISLEELKKQLIAKSKNLQA